MAALSPKQDRQPHWSYRMLATLLIGLILAPASVDASPDDVALGTRSSQPPAVDILQLNKKMADFLVRHVTLKSSSSHQVDDLMNAIFGRKGLNITYDSTATMTARETFEARHGNCMSFTILFVAMARHIGLDAYFQEVSEVISWDRRGEVVVRNQHMVVEVEIENGRQTVDFLPEAEKRYRAVRRISDERALAHYYNNLGVEALAAGDYDLAQAYFGRSLEADPALSYALTNLGVAQRRLGDFPAAERSHLQALEIDKNESAAMTNLASFYLATGREAEAQPLLRRIDDDLKRNPFHHFKQGMANSRRGELTEAIRDFREAIRRMPEELEFHSALAEAYAETGERDKARVSFEKALSLAEDRKTRERLRKELSRL
ncbi:MAG: tetratricopeptide repeat protein [Acidobacteriota bacterium]